MLFILSNTKTSYNLNFIDFFSQCYNFYDMGLSNDLSLNLIPAYSRPRIVHITPNQIIDIDSTVELRCTVSDTMNLPVIWIKHDFEKSTVPRLISATSGIIVKDFRFSMKKEELNISSKYTLQVS